VTAASPLSSGSPAIDLNADLGEGFGRWSLDGEAEMLRLVTSANVACGFHAGDPVRMRETVALARRAGVIIGAHPGYPDLLGFGRREMGATPAEVGAYVVYQLGALQAVARAAGAEVAYVKPHGALYNRAAREPEIASAIAEAVAAVDPALALLGLAGSALVAAARQAGLRAVREAFIDRGYEPDGTLVPRDRPGAFIEDPAAAADRAVGLARDRTVIAVDGQPIPVEADSLCVHGDGARAVATLGAVRAALESAGIAVRAFAR
jgi:UPF0271 protein